MADLESPSAADDLYRYRAPDVPRSRPIIQGDVFRDVTIPGLEQDPGLAMVLTHACSMRQGANLRAHLLMGRVAPQDHPIDLPWKGNFGVMPLPALMIDQAEMHFALNFEEIGTVSTGELDLHRRIACLDDHSICLLNQRNVHCFTRVVIEAAVLYEQSANVLAEAELLEDWLEAGIREADADWQEKVDAETINFDSFLGPWRGDLKRPALRAGVRGRVNREIRSRFG